MLGIDVKKGNYAEDDEREIYETKDNTTFNRILIFTKFLYYYF